MSQDSIKGIDRLVSQCDNHFSRIMKRMCYCSDENMAEVWRKAHHKFTMCLVLSSREQSTNPESILYNKSLADIAGGIDRYPSTASFLIGILRGLEQSLGKTVEIIAEQKLRGTSPREKRGLSTLLLEDPTLRSELHSLNAAITGSLMVLSYMQEHVCPHRNSWYESYHDHCLAAYEHGLTETILQEKERREA